MLSSFKSRSNIPLSKGEQPALFLDPDFNASDSLEARLDVS